MQIEPGPALHTDRLLLRRWRPEDRAPFAELNADPAVMEFFPSSLAAAESDALAERADAAFDTDGFGLFAVEVLGGDPFVGFVGLNAFSNDEPSPLPFAPGVEVGWRLARHVWGRGYAPEAARACLAFGFEAIGIEEIVSFTSVINERSRQVMRKIGMHYDPEDDFEHPRVPVGSPLRPHVLYRIEGDLGTGRLRQA
ncbi:MAG: GNAT family N-acetyltransferase [Acidimicrobiales bacterium]